MAEIKLIALDLDGTLLDDSKRLSAKNESVLKECIRRGIQIVPCTGRIWSGVPEFLRCFPGIRYAITVNGAVVLDADQDKVISERKMDNRLACEILELAKGFHTMYDAYIDGQGYGEDRFLSNLDEFHIVKTVQEMIRSTRVGVSDLFSWVKENGKDVEKINYFFADDTERKRARSALEHHGGVIISSSLSNNLEINAPGATKGEAILMLAEYLGIRQEETMGIGDGENDLNMMKMAGIGVAMGNAQSAIREAADYVTLTNEESGVADAIERLVFDRERKGV